MFPGTFNMALGVGGVQRITPIIPSEHFKVVKYTGNGSTQSITGLNFQPDLVWIKNEDANNTSFVLADVLRGAGNELHTNTADIAAANADTVTAFNADGFSVGADTNTGTNAQDYIAWCFKAGGAVSADNNTVGSITSTVSANTTAGFSVLSYTGNGSSGSTVGHGLDQTPELIIVKATAGSPASWAVYSEHCHPNPETVHMDWNAVYIPSTNPTYWNDTLPTSSVFSLGNSVPTNFTTLEYMAMCFHSVEGFSKFGSYTGNGSSTAGPYIDLGFRPAYVVVKRVSGGADGWHIFDNQLNPDNTTSQYFLSNSTDNARTNANVTMEFQDEGFTVEGTSAGVNSNGDDYIYLAFAA